MTTEDIAPTLTRYSSRICAEIIQEGEMLVDAIEDRIGLSSSTCAALLSKLCASGVLKRNRDYVRIGDVLKATALAEQFRPAEKKAAPSAPAAAPEPVKRAPRPSLPKMVFADGIKIDKGIAMPERGGRPTVERPWPFARMAVGDSFEVPLPEGMTIAALANMLRGHAGQFCRVNTGFQFALRTAEDRKSIRLWREELPKADPVTTASSLGIRTRRAGGKNG